ncbi:MAG: GlsB/YeaQ/YmgE family stress response membrane protein [Candidatus Methylomirabilota bacterium]|jgi:uncharacterized membrane protein YeaQ/YmgE (transglycosylase-associated protein family)
MTLGLFVMWVVVGLVVGWLAGFVMKSGGYGVKGDLILGLVGSIVGSWLFWALGISPDAGLVALVVVAFIGAAIAIVAQRKLWYGYA